MKPVLLLVPGILNDAHVWDEVAAALDRSAHVRTMDTLVQESIGAMAQAAWDAVADVGSEVPLLVGGFSMGGYVALRMLAQPARPLAGAALVSTSARPESAEAAARREKTIAAFQRDFPRAVDGLLEWSTHAAGADARRRLRAMMLGVGAETAIRQSRATMARADHRAALAALRLPTTVLVGCEDRITPPELSQELAALLPDARLQLVEGAGHMLPVEDPHAVAAALASLVERACAAPADTDNQGDR